MDRASRNSRTPRPKTLPLAGVPWSVAQDVMGRQQMIIIMELAKVLVQHAQDVIRAQPVVFKEESGRHPDRGAQDEMVRGPPAIVG